MIPASMKKKYFKIGAGGKLETKMKSRQFDFEEKGPVPVSLRSGRRAVDSEECGEVVYHVEFTVTKMVLFRQAASLPDLPRSSS